MTDDSPDNNPLPKTVWDKLGDAIQDPWDWAAATGGGAAGALVSIAVGFSDLGSAIAGGALAAVSLRKAGSAASARPKLRRRARALRRLINKLEGNEAQRLSDAVDTELELFDSKAMKAEDFARKLDELVD